MCQSTKKKETLEGTLRKGNLDLSESWILSHLFCSPFIPNQPQAGHLIIESPALQESCNLSECAPPSERGYFLCHRQVTVFPVLTAGARIPAAHSRYGPMWDRYVILQDGTALPSGPPSWPGVTQHTETSLPAPPAVQQSF